MYVTKSKLFIFIIVSQTSKKRGEAKIKENQN
jgi:hypothetical protein